MRYLLSIFLLTLLLPSNVYTQSIGQEPCELTPREKSADLFIKWAPIVLAAWCAVMTSRYMEGQGPLNDSNDRKQLLARITDLENGLEATKKRLDRLEQQRIPQSIPTSSSVPHRLPPKLQRQPSSGDMDPRRAGSQQPTSSYSTLPSAEAAGSVPSQD